MSSSAVLSAKREVSPRDTMKHMMSFDSDRLMIDKITPWTLKRCPSQWKDTIANEQRRCCLERGHQGHHHWNSNASGYTELADYDVMWSDDSPLVMFRG